MAGSGGVGVLSGVGGETVPGPLAGCDSGVAAGGRARVAVGSGGAWRLVGVPEGMARGIVAGFGPGVGAWTATGADSGVGIAVSGEETVGMIRVGAGERVLVGDGGSSLQAISRATTAPASNNTSFIIPPPPQVSEYILRMSNPLHPPAAQRGTQRGPRPPARPASAARTPRPGRSGRLRRSRGT